MYLYNETDQRLVDDRVTQFRGQMARFLAGRLSEDDFRPLRLQNGLYIQRHAPMLRVAIPYGTLSSRQLRKLADIARRYDRGYGRFTIYQGCLEARRKAGKGGGAPLRPCRRMGCRPSGGVSASPAPPKTARRSRRVSTYWPRHGESACANAA